MENSQDHRRARQDQAMIEQFKGRDYTDQSELRDWQHVRRAAARKLLKRPAR